MRNPSRSLDLNGLSINGWDGISFCTNANTRNERMRIDKDGNVNIGTTGQAFKLYVNGDTKIDGLLYLKNQIWHKSIDNVNRIKKNF